MYIESVQLKISEIMILWNLIWHRGRIYFTEIMPRERQISWKRFIYVERLSRTREAKIKI